MNSIPKACLIGVVTAAALVSSTAIDAHARSIGKKVQELEYKSNISTNTANDLHVVFKGRASNVKFHHSGDKTSIGDVNTDNGGNTSVDWYHQGSNALDDTVPAGESREISWDGGGEIDKTKSYWTRDGAELVDALASIGSPADFYFEDVGGGAFAVAEFSNPEPFDIVYTDLKLMLDGDLGLFDEDPFGFESGYEFQDLPDEIYLSAGESVYIDLGFVANSTFQVVEAFAYAAEDPLDTYRVASANALVPEPSADFNGDGMINGDDLQFLQNGYGITVNAIGSDGDADGDGDVDGHDFLAFQRGFNAPVALSNSTGSVSPVPEPAAGVLYLISLVGAAVIRVRRG